MQCDYEDWEVCDVNYMSCVQPRNVHQGDCAKKQYVMSLACGTENESPDVSCTCWSYHNSNGTYGHSTRTACKGTWRIIDE